MQQSRECSFSPAEPSTHLLLLLPPVQLCGAAFFLWSLSWLRWRHPLDSILMSHLSVTRLPVLLTIRGITMVSFLLYG